MQCEGWRRKGGAFTLGPVKWEQCKNDAVVMLTVQQKSYEGREVQEYPACMECWNEAIAHSVKIIEAKPLLDKPTKEEGMT